MIVHPNPMIKLKNGNWIDTHFERVEVRYFQVNYGKHRDRWGVYAARRTGSPRLITSKHITEEQAVVSAQTLANRIKRTVNRKKRKAGSNRQITVTQGDMQKLLVRIQETLPSDAQWHEISEKISAIIKVGFKLP